MTNQPNWELIANLGDVHPLDYGGYFIYRDTTGVYTEEGEKVFVDDEENENSKYTIYRFGLDRCEMVAKDGKTYLVPFGFASRTDLPYAIETYDEWFDKRLDEIAQSVEQSIEEMREAFCSADPLIRAFAYEAVGNHFGFDNLDNYPLVLTKAEAEERYTRHRKIEAA